MCKFIVSGFVVVFMLNFSDALKEDCNKKEAILERCAMTLPVLSPKEMSFALTHEELDKNCEELQSRIKCVNDFARECMGKDQQLLFTQVYSSITDVIGDLCTRGEYQDEYLKHASCVKRVRPQYDTCSKRYDEMLASISRGPSTLEHQIEREHSMRTVCCAFQEYLTCSEQTVQSVCGEEAALFTSAFLKRMASNIITYFCLEFRGHECGMPDKATSIDHSILMISIAVFVNLVAYMSDALVPT